jgi:phosphoenolpyruvate carboxykinase (GTP)
MDVSGLGLTDDQLDLLLTVDAPVWREEASLIPEFFEKFGERTPKALWDQHAALVKRLA